MSQFSEISPRVSKRRRNLATARRTNEADVEGIIARQDQLGLDVLKKKYL